jgi:hypothetical protein
MKGKGKSAWLVTWEGPEAENLARCKVVAILPPQMGEEAIKLLLRVLFCSEYPLTLDEKLCFGTARDKDMPRYFHQYYKEMNSELNYGHMPKQYLSARKVKNLRCEESKSDIFLGTLFWTELPKYIRTRKDPSDELTEFFKMVCEEKHRSYTYSSRR